jgi:hypothetical protein
MKLPAFQFYPGDWRKDPGVQALDYHDRGVWLEMICLMHESEERGKLLLNGKPMPDDALARLLGLEKQVFLSTMNTLLSYGVASIDEKTGAVVCRRMVRDDENRAKSKEAGATGGNPKLTTGYNSPGFLYAIRDPQTQHVKIGIASNYHLRIKKIGYKLGRQMETLLVVPVEDMGTKEAQVHAELAPMRVSGEWFKIPDDFISTLKGIMKGKETVGDKGKARASSSSSSSSSSSEYTNGASLREEPIDGAKLEAAIKGYCAAADKRFSFEAVKAAVRQIQGGSVSQAALCQKLAAIAKTASRNPKSERQFLPGCYDLIEHGQYDSELSAFLSGKVADHTTAPMTNPPVVEIF